MTQFRFEIGGVVSVLLCGWAVVSVLAAESIVDLLTDEKLRSNSSIHSSVIMSIGMAITCPAYGRLNL